MWKNKDQNIGRVPENSTQIITFVMEPEVNVPAKQVKRTPLGFWMITTSCGCSSADWNPNSKTLRVTYNTGQVPPHLVVAGAKAYTTSKNIKLTFTDDTTETLVFTATVFKN